MVRISRVRSLAHRSTSRWRKRVSTSDTPFHLSPNPRRASASSTHAVDLHRQLALAGAHDLPRRAHPVPERQLGERLELRGDLRQGEQLHLTRRVAQGGEGQPPLGAHQHDPARHRDDVLALLPGPERGVAVVQCRRPRRSGRRSRGRRPRSATLPGHRGLPTTDRSRRAWSCARRRAAARAT